MKLISNNIARVAHYLTYCAKLAVVFVLQVLLQVDRFVPIKDPLKSMRILKILIVSVSVLSK